MSLSQLGMRVSKTVKLKKGARRRRYERGIRKWKFLNFFYQLKHAGLFRMLIAHYPHAASRIFGGHVMLVPTWRAQLTHEGVTYDLGIVGYNLIVSDFVNFLVDLWNNTAGTTLTTYQYIGLGSGTTAPAIGDTALETEFTTQLNPNSTRATGTYSQPQADTIQIEGTLTFDASAAVTEVGLLNNATVGSGDLCERDTFSVLNVVNGDDLTFQYQIQFPAGS